MFQLTRLSVANKSIIALATAAIILLGAYIIPSFQQELLPALTYPAISIISSYPGATPTQVEHDVTNPIEQTLQGLQGLQEYDSHSAQNTSVIVVNYQFGTDIDKASQALTTQIAKVQSTLPTNVKPQLRTYRFADAPIVLLAAQSAQTQQDLAIGLKQVVVPALQGINGVANVTITGVRQNIVTVTLDPKKLQTNGLSILQVQSAIQASNLTQPAGSTTLNDKTLAIQVGNNFNTIQDLENIEVGVRQSPTGPGASAGAPGATRVAPTFVKLSDVATVQQEIEPSSTLTRTNGQPTLGISITKTSAGNSVSISHALKALLPGLESKLGYNAHLIVASDQAPYIETSVNDLIREGALGAVFAVLVILLFLFSIRSTLVTAISIPLSVIIALIGLWSQNFSLNILTLSGLTIAIGRVVDDSIVVLENIYRHLRNGEEKQEAILAGVKDVAGAVTASTLTTVAVFLPLAFIGGITGEYTHPLAFSVTIALLASLFVALMVIPVLAAWFLKAPKNVTLQADGREKPNWLERGYIPMISWVTKHRAITIIGSLVLLGGSLALFPTLPVNAFNSGSPGRFSFDQTLPLNTSLAITDQAAKQVEAALVGIPHVQTYQVTVGANGTNIAAYVVNTDLNADPVAVQQATSDRLKKLSGIGTITFGNQGSNTTTVTVQAGDVQVLQQATQQVLTALADTPNTRDITSDLANAAPLIDVRVDTHKALQHGLTSLQVSQSLQMVYSGTTVTHITLNGAQQDVDLKLLGAAANSIQQMQDILIQSPTGNVRLGDIATVNQANGPTTVSHFNGARTATITLAVTNQNVGAVNRAVRSRITALKLPSGATADLGAASVAQGQTLNDLYLALLIAIPLVFLVMVATFRSLIQPLILLVAIPFAALGSLVLAAITHTAVGVSSLFGFLMLIGVVVTNAIVLIDRINHYRIHEGMSPRDAVIEGGRHRVRPILMTAIATITALLPMAFGAGSSSAVISGGLAIVVIGGLTSSTFLTLLLVPTLYVIVEDTKDRFKKKPAETVVAPEKELVAQ